ncbi:hypothetical protein [Geopseudomonas aromaticivorans]
MANIDSQADLPGDKSHAELTPDGPSASQLRHSPDSAAGALERKAQANVDLGRVLDHAHDQPQQQRRRIEIKLDLQQQREDTRDHETGKPAVAILAPAVPPSYRGASLQSAIGRTAREIEHLKGTQKALVNALAAISDDDDVNPAMRAGMQARLNATNTLITSKGARLGSLRARAGGYRASSTPEVQSNRGIGLIDAAADGIDATSGIVSPMDPLMEDPAPGAAAAAPKASPAKPANEQRLVAICEGVFAIFRQSFVNAGCQGGSSLKATASAMGVQETAAPVALAPQQAYADPTPFDFPPSMTPRPHPYKDGRRR